MTTVGNAVEWGRDKLITSSLEENNPLKQPRDRVVIEVESLLAHVLNKTRVWVVSWNEQSITEQQFQDFQSLIQRRSNKEPMAYLIGMQEFWSMNLKVTRDTLIPRPETELLVEIALELIPAKQEFKLADLGTGSGAIALSIASERRQAIVFAVDFSENALAVAETNRNNNNISNVQTIQSNWLNDWQHGQLDMIVSNPPYVEADDPHLANLTFEPQQALVALEKGLGDIRIIAEQSRLFLKSGAYLIFEHGFDQGMKVREILSKLNYQSIETRQDLAKLDRVTLACMP